MNSCKRYPVITGSQDFPLSSSTPIVSKVLHKEKNLIGLHLEYQCFSKHECWQLLLFMLICIYRKKVPFFVRINEIVPHRRINVSTQRDVLLYPERFVRKHVRTKTFPLENSTERKYFLMSKHFTMPPIHLISRFNMI